jgi:DNA-binding response OmpR family regulator
MYMERRRILIIDDDPDIRTLMNIVLKKNGFEVHSASKESEVFGSIQSFQPHLILLDVLLSGADGRVICERIKANVATAGIPVIMCSAHPAVLKQEVPADDFLSKPFTEEVLMQKIERQLAKKESPL